MVTFLHFFFNLKNVLQVVFEYLSDFGLFLFVQNFLLEYDCSPLSVSLNGNI